MAAFLVFFFIFSSFCPTRASAQCNVADANALAAIRDELSVHEIWRTSVDEKCCSWSGVKCDEVTGRVTELNLSKVKFSSSYTYPAALGDLEELRILDISINKSNRQEITLPDSLQNLKNLKHLILSNNVLLTIPPWLDQLSNLEVLRLDGVPLKGEDFPSSIGKLSSTIKILDLSSSYDYLDIERMFFKPRSFPDWLCTLENLEELHMNHARLTNVPIPDCLSTLTKLHTLRLGFNQITGGIPEDLVAYFSNLKALDLSHNLLTGGIPSTVPKSLVFLNLAYNRLNGTIPTSFTGFPALSFVGNSGLFGLPLEPSEGQKML